MPITTLGVLTEVKHISDNFVTFESFALLFFGWASAVLAVFLKVAAGKRMLSDIAWTINSLLFTAIGFWSMIPLTVTSLFCVGHRFDAEKLHLSFSQAESIIVLGMLMSAGCAVVTILSMLKARSEHKLESKMPDQKKMVALSLFISIALIGAVCSVPYVGSDLVGAVIVKRTCELPASFGTSIRKFLLSKISWYLPSSNNRVSWLALNSYSDMKDYASVTKLTTRLLENPKLNQYDKSGLFYRRAVANQMLDKFDLAIDDFSKSFEINPDANADPLLHKAFCLEKTGRDFAALQELDKALVLAPNDFDVYNLKSKILLKVNNPLAALDCINRKQELAYGRTPYSHLLKALTLEKLGKNDEARNELSKITEIDDEYDNFDWKVMRALCYTKLGDSNRSDKIIHSITESDRMRQISYARYELSTMVNDVKVMIHALMPNDDIIKLVYPLEN